MKKIRKVGKANVVSDIALQKVEAGTANFCLPFPSSWEKEGAIGFGDVRIMIQLDRARATSLLVSMDAVGMVPTWIFAKLFDEVLNWVTEEAEEIFYVVQRVDTVKGQPTRLWASARLSVSDRWKVFNAVIEKAEKARDKNENR